MKKIYCFIAILSILIVKINAQNTSEKDNSLIDNFMKSKVSINKEKLVSDTLAKVFDGTFYKVDAGFAVSDVMTSCSGGVFNVKNGVISVLDSRNDSMLVLLSLIRKDFYLKTPADGKVFEACLDKFYPISDLHLKDKERLKIGNKWYFIRDKFFDSKSGYIVTLDQNFRIVNIANELEAIKK